MAKPGRILIVGGGIAGLTAAAALHQRGFAAELIERDAEWRTVGGGIAVQPNGMRVLRRLGIADAVERAGMVVRRWLFRDQHGDVLCANDLEALWGAVGPFIGIERSKLQASLLAGAAAVSCRLGIWITALAQDDHGVSVACNDGNTGHYDVVVGADGIASTVRRLALGAASPVYSGQMTWRSVAPLHPGKLEGVQFWLGDACFFGLCPVGGGRTYGFGNVTAPHVHDPVPGRCERLRRHFAGFGGLVRDYLAALEGDERIHCGAVEWLESDQWHNGRVVLIGDAAHASSPMMGQGGCMAMEDALVLAEVLDSAADVESALAAFAGRRRPRVTWVQQESRAVGKSLDMPPAMRNQALREHGTKKLCHRFEPLTAPP